MAYTIEIDGREYRFRKDGTLYKADDKANLRRQYKIWRREVSPTFSDCPRDGWYRLGGEDYMQYDFASRKTNPFTVPQIRFYADYEMAKETVEERGGNVMLAPYFTTGHSIGWGRDNGRDLRVCAVTPQEAELRMVELERLVGVAPRTSTP